MKIIHEKSSKLAQEYVNIAGVRVDGIQKGQLLREIREKIQFAARLRSQKRSFYILTPNPEIVVQAQSDRELAHSLSLADFSIPDGVGLKFAALLQGKHLEIIKGRQLMLDILEMANQEKWRVFLLGGSALVNRNAVEEIGSRYPGVSVKGESGPVLDIHAEPALERDRKLESDAINEINKFAPHILYVAFGTPKEQKWIMKWLPKLKVYCVMEVGGAFNYLAGSASLPPEWVNGIGFEWLWRLIHEPKRIKRIINAVIVFPLLALKERAKGH